MGTKELSISIFTLEVACKEKLNWELPSTQKEKLLLVLFILVPALELVVITELDAPLQFLAQTCMSLVTKPILDPFLDSFTLIAATDVPVLVVLIHKSPVNASQVDVPEGKGCK